MSGTNTHIQKGEHSTDNGDALYIRTIKMMRSVSCGMHAYVQFSSVVYVHEWGAIEMARTD